MTSCWGITNGSAGMVSQVRALAVTMGLDPQMKTIAIKAPFSYLPNIVYANAPAAYAMPLLLSDRQALAEPYPDIIISCGRRSAIAAMSLRRRLLRQQKRPYFIHIQDPQVASRHFDMVVAMKHDRIEGNNVLKTRFALHTVTRDALMAAERHFSAQFSLYPKPHVAVLLGGSTNKYHLRAEDMKEVIAKLKSLLQITPGSLLITPSRRTGEKNIALLHDAFAGHPRVYIYDFMQENPYMGLLALADVLIVTNDSVNMMSEAHATGKTLYLLPLPGHDNTKPARFARRLMDDHLARPLGQQLDRWSYPVENEMAQLVEEIKQRGPF